jgi:hypothetical protein
MTPLDAIIDCPTIIAMLLDAEGVTEYDPLLEGVRFALGQRASDAQPDKITALIADMIDCAYGRPDLSNIEWGLLLDMIHAKMEGMLEGSDLELR